MPDANFDELLVELEQINRKLDAASPYAIEERADLYARGVTIARELRDRYREQVAHFLSLEKPDGV